MNKCLKITLILKSTEGILQNFVQKNAQKFNIEGTVQSADNETIKIIACSKVDNLDKFIDSLYQGYKNNVPQIIEIEPFLKDKDYRGVFRIIE